MITTTQESFLLPTLDFVLLGLDLLKFLFRLGLLSFLFRLSLLRFLFSLGLLDFSLSFLMSFLNRLPPFSPFFEFYFSEIFNDDENGLGEDEEMKDELSDLGYLVEDVDVVDDADVDHVGN